MEIHIATRMYLTSSPAPLDFLAFSVARCMIGGVSACMVAM